ncbi:hypothetical protein BRD00_00075 [Halobacteriales archaeon QS_8_69_26]|nr:MAG: hypothetical protein BRD00_00075 [Halobacteriales archaeon QS_8_69_26]
MGYDLGRAVLAVCSVLAVLIAASAFPAAGFGALPGGGDGDTGVAEGPGGDGPPTTGGDGATTVPGDSTGEGNGTDTTTEDGGETTTDGTTESDGTTTAGETPTATTKSTTTEDPSDSDDDSVLAPLVSLLLGAVVWALGAITVLGLVLGLVGMATGTVAVERAATGTVLTVGSVEFQVGSAVQGISRSTMSYVLAISASAARLVDQVGTAMSAAGSGFGPALSALVRSGSGALSSLPTAMGTVLAGSTRALGGALVAIPSGLGALVGGLGGLSTPDWATPSRDPRDASPVPPSEEAVEEEETPPESVEEAWAAFVEHLGARNTAARTPGELARAAVDAGLPSDAVERLTGTFRAVRYGGVPPSEDRLRAALSALEEIRRHGGEES